MAEKVRNLSTLDRCGNAVALDFVNTVHSRAATDSHEYLRTYADLAKWSLDGGLVSANDCARLISSANSRASVSGGTLRRAIELRELLYRMFIASIRNKKISPGDLAVFNDWLASTLARRWIRQTGEKFRWSWKNGENTFDRPLWPVVLSAANLLAADELRQIKECPMPEGCGWLFRDISKNGKRKWCNMKTCGNVVKARRYYRRHSKGKTKNVK